MIIETAFEVPLGPERALDVLTDVPSIAPCIPGVTLTENAGDGSYKGEAAVRLGPVALTFAGTARIVAVDKAGGTARVEAEGADRKGRGRATARVNFTLSPAGTGTRVAVVSDVALTGQVAQYGRASGLINEVANQIVAAFAQNLAVKLSAEGGDGRAAVAQPARKQEISGLTLLFRALAAMIARLFTRQGRG